LPVKIWKIFISKSYLYTIWIYRLSYSICNRKRSNMRNIIIEIWSTSNSLFWPKPMIQTSAS